MPRVLLLILIAGLTACRTERMPSGSQPLPDPVTTYPERSTTKAPAANAAAPAAPTQKPSDNVIWEQLGHWSGTGNLQSESFTGQTGALRFKWETRAVKGRPEGTFLLTVHSAISGRPLQVAVDQRGPGADTAFINEDPRVFFAVVEAKDIEWSFSVDEAIGTRTIPGK